MESENQYLNDRWYQIQSLIQKAADDGLKYLTILNGGGTLALLSFIAASPSKSNNCLWLSFVIFFIGLMLVGVVHLWRYTLLESMLTKWGKDSDNYRVGKLQYEELIEKDNKRAKKGDKIFYLAVICFFMPIVGFAIGIMKVLNVCFCS